MGAAVGGSIESISLKGRLFPVAADADAGRNLGGFTNEVQANGDGTARLVKKRMPWKLGGLDVEINDDRADLEFLQEISDGLEFVPISITLANGNTYQGKGTITGDVESSTEKATAGITLEGPQTLEAQ
jgi:hypothetical protein